MSSIRGILPATALAVPLALAGCGDDDPAARWTEGKGSSAAPLMVSLTPAANTTNLPISTEIGISARGAATTTATLVDNKQTKVAGSFRADSSSWVPDRPLRFKTTYVATVTVTAADGRTATQSTTFTTMSEPRGERVGSGLYLFDGLTYGVGMPVVVEFESEIAEEARAEVEKRLFVTSDPPQPGVWHWFSGRQVLYRAPAYWIPNTKLTVRLALDGHPMGRGRYGDMDRRASVTIGRKLSMQVDNATKQMSVFENDKLIRTMPVSLGKPATPSSSGTMVVMDRQEQTVFDTTNDPNPENRYRVDIDFAQRLTWDGEFIHSAPWSEGDQGIRNVSHGCVNLSAANARWLFNRTKVGDPVTVTGTERRLEPGNGWTAWDLTWADYVKGSALPHPEFAVTSPGPQRPGSPNNPAPSPSR